jgi:Choline/Carnitine o-acyltransferase
MSSRNGVQPQPQEAPESNNITFAFQSKLPKLPIPPLEDTCRRYLQALVALQDEDEHELTKKAVKEFLDGDGPKIHAQLVGWAKDKDRCVRKLSLRRILVERFCQLHRGILVTVYFAGDPIGTSQPASAGTNRTYRTQTPSCWPSIHFSS